MKALIDKPHGLFLLLAGLFAFEVFCVYLLMNGGLIQLLLAADSSYISGTILAIYGLASFHILVVAFDLSQEFESVQRRNSARSAGSRIARFFDMLNQASRSGDESDALLIEALDGRCRQPYRFGYVFADLMLKLGLLGTVIGFILMLGSLVNLNSIDITVMQKLLAEMSGGMKVALFTTLGGLISGVLLNMKYQLLDWSVDCLLDDIREATYCLRSQ